MPRRSTIQDHPDKALIERALASGKASIRQIADQFKVSRAALYRYARERIGPALAKAATRRELKTGDAVLEEFREQFGILKSLIESAVEHLSDPAGPPGKLTFASQAGALEVLIEKQEEDENGRMRRTRQKATLQSVLDGHPEIVQVFNKADDPRRLLIQASEAAGAYLERFGRIFGIIKTGTAVTFNTQVLNFGASLEGKKAFGELHFEEWMLSYGGPVAEIAEVYNKVLHYMSEAEQKKFLDIWNKLIDGEPVEEPKALPPASDA